MYVIVVRGISLDGGCTSDRRVVNKHASTISDVLFYEK